MKKFNYYSPTEIEFGERTEEKAGALCKKYGASRVFIVYGSHSAERSGLIDRVKKSVEEVGLPCEAMGGVVANPLLSTVRKLIERARAFEADFILAVGGGSVMDSAKAVAHGLANPQTDVWEFWTGKPVAKSLPIGCVLTISAAGSETSDSAVITNDEIEPPSKRGCTTNFNRCRFAVMDPLLTMTLPKYQIGAGAADIFMHTAERFFAPILGNHLTDEIAAGLFRDIIKYGPIATDDPQNYEAMSEVMWCGSVSHIGLTGLGARGDLGRDGDWACHQLGMAVSALYDATHGATLTAVFGTWARYVCGENIDRFAEFAKMVFGIEAADAMEASEQAIERVEQFFTSLGMPITMTDLLGHTPSEEEISALADVCSYQRTRTIGSFRTLDLEDMKEIYRRAK